MMRRSLLLIPSLMLALAGSVNATGDDAANSKRKARVFKVETALASTNEVPVISSLNASGNFKATLDEDNLTITWELSYQGLEGTPTAAHLHVGQRGVNGAIPLFLCANAPALPPVGTLPAQACPAAPATITGVLTPANIITRAAQGIDGATPADFLEIMQLMRSSNVYANVHSTKYPAGEIRGQVRRDRPHNSRDSRK